MLEAIENLCSPSLREVVGFGVSATALVLLVVRGRGGGWGVFFVLLAGLAVLSFSFLVGLLAMVFGTIDPGRTLSVFALVFLRVYVGLPLVLLGGVLGAASSLGGRIVSSGASGLVAPQYDHAAQDTSRLRESLAKANRDLEQTRNHIGEQATETNRLNNKLRETLNLLLTSEEKFRTIFERANDGFVVLDVGELTIVQANPRMAALTGFEAEELKRRRLADLCGDEIRTMDPDRLRDALTRGSLPPVTLKRRDGSVRQVEMSFSLVDVGGSPILLGIVGDVSESVRLKEELDLKNRILEDGELELSEANQRLSDDAEKMREMNDRLRELQAVKDNFLSSVSHELRTPLTSIRSFSEILLENDDADDEVKREFISIINKESERLTRLVNDVLDLAKIEAGEMRFEMDPVDMNLLAREVVRSLAPLAQENGISVESRLPPDLPAAHGERDRLHQVLTNLLSNALKFAQRETVVVLSARGNDEGMIEFSVEDRGPGIPREELAGIFEKFRQGGDTLTEKPAGTGLGLAICREIITLHGGRVWVRSKTGHGSTFFFTVKAAPTGVSKRPKKKMSIADKVRAAAESARRGEPSELDLAFMGEAGANVGAADEPESALVEATSEIPPLGTTGTRNPVTRELGNELPPLARGTDDEEGKRRNLPPMLDRS